VISNLPAEDNCVIIANTIATKPN